MAGVMEGITIVINGDATPFKRAMREAKAEGTMLSRHLQTVNKLIKFDPGSLELLTRRQQLLNASLAQNATHLARLKEMNAAYAANAANLTDAERRQWMQVQRRMSETELQYAQLRQQAIQYGAAASAANLRLTAGARGLQAALKTVSTQMLAVSTVTGLVGAASLYAAAQFEASFAGVRKTIIATEEEYRQLARASRDLALVKPVSVNDINRIMELGGQLNIATRYLTKFASVMADLDVSTNMDLEEGSLALARFMNITNMAQADVDRLGATIVDLGNNSATTENDIMLMAMRIAGSGRNIGLSAQNVLALATALSSVGIQAEMGGNAISTIMNRIDKAVALDQKTLSTWAATAGMTTEDFKYNWTNNVQDTLIAVIKGMGTFREEGGNLNVLLKDMGISYMRQIDTMQRLSRAGQLTEELFVRANTAWANNTALVREATQRYSTAESKLNMMKNAIYEVGITIGNEILPYFSDLVVGVTDVIHAFAQMSPEAKTAVISIGGIVTASGFAVKAVEMVAGGVGKASEAFASLKTWMVLSADGCAKYSKQAIALATSLGADAVAAQQNALATAANARAKEMEYRARAHGYAVIGREALAKEAETLASAQNTIAIAANNEAQALGASLRVQAATSTGILAAAHDVLTAKTWALSAALGITNGALLGIIAAAAGLAVVAVAVANATNPMNRLTKASQEQSDAVDAARDRWERLSKTQGEHADETVKAKAAYEELDLQFKESTETVGEFEIRMRDAVKAAKELREEIDDATAQADSDAGRILNTVDSIKELRNAASDDQKLELSALVADLNSQVEGLDLTMADAVDGTDKFTIALKKAEEQANKVRYENAYDQFGKLNSIARELEGNLEEMRKQYEGIEDQTSNVSKMAELWDMGVSMGSYSTQISQYRSMQNEIANVNLAMEAQKAIIKATADQSALYEMAMRYSNDANVDLATAIAFVNEKFGAYITESGLAIYKEQQVAQASAEASENIDAFAESIDKMSASFPGFADAMEDIGATSMGLAGYLSDAGVSVEDFEKAVEDAYGKATDFFNKMERDQEVTLEQIIENLQANKRYFDEFSDNITVLYDYADKAGNEAWKSFLRGLDPTDEGVAQMVALLAADPSRLGEVYDSWYQAGESSVEATASGIGAKSGEGRAAMAKYVDGLNSEMEKYKTGTKMMEFVTGSSWDASSAKVSLITGKIAGFIRGSSATSTSIVQGAVNAQKSAISSGTGSMYSTASSNFAAIGESVTQVKKYNGSVRGWMNDMMTNLILGIKEKMGEFNGAVSGVADGIAAALRHSVPKEGPLHEGGRGEVVWGEHLMDNLIEGIRSREPELQSQMDRVAWMMKGPIDDMSPDWDAGSGIFSSSAISNTNVTNVTLNLDYAAGDDAQQMARDVARELNVIMNTEA